MEGIRVKSKQNKNNDFEQRRSNYEEIEILFSRTRNRNSEILNIPKIYIHNIWKKLQ